MIDVMVLDCVGGSNARVGQDLLILALFQDGARTRSGLLISCAFGVLHTFRIDFRTGRAASSSMVTTKRSARRPKAQFCLSEGVEHLLSEKGGARETAIPSYRAVMVPSRFFY